MGTWQPTDPATDLYSGGWSPTGGFFRLDVEFDRLINPPGTLGNGFPFEPFRYGPHPIFGYIELDMDADVQTGGEFSETKHRYTGGIARFGGHPSGKRYAGRVAIDGRDSFPRTGEEFHLAFHGWEIETFSDPNGNGLFEAGESWRIRGRLFHRSHAFEKFSYACCQGLPGSYEPLVEIQFRHSTATDTTTVSLVYPLTNAAAAGMSGLPVEFLDGDASNQNSVQEALDDLVFSVLYAPPGWKNNPDWPVIAAWGGKDPADHLDPTCWELTIMAATSYTSKQPTLYVWTDMNLDVIVGDMTGNARVDSVDLAAFDGYLAANDGLASFDADGPANGSITLKDFGTNFSLYDVDYDGRVNGVDRLSIQGRRTPLADFDRDIDVDLADFALLQRCLGEPRAGEWSPRCDLADLDRDGQVGPQDVQLFQECASGSGIAADLLCAD